MASSRWGARSTFVAKEDEWPRGESINDPEPINGLWWYVCGWDGHGHTTVDEAIKCDADNRVLWMEVNPSIYNRHDALCECAGCKMLLEWDDDGTSTCESDSTGSRIVEESDTGPAYHGGRGAAPSRRDRGRNRKAEQLDFFR